MKKHFLTIITLAFGALVLITNCKKKEDSPAPATTTTGGTTSGTTSGTTTSGTTTGTTTSGTTTAGTTTSGTTTSGTSTAGTTTSGTTTAGTTSGSTTSGVVANKWTIGTQSFTGTAGSPVWNGGGNNWGFMGNGSLDSLVAFQIWFNTNSPSSGVYSVKSYLTTLDGTSAKVNASLGSNAYYSIEGGTVTVVNTNGVVSATVANVTCAKSILGTGERITVSGNLTN